MVTPVVTDLYTSVGCNRTPHALDWANNNGLVCFGASHAIAIYDPKVRSTLCCNYCLMSP